MVFEIDQPKVLDYRRPLSPRTALSPPRSATRWLSTSGRIRPTALQAARFDPARPTAWLAEGLLMYLPAEAQDRLFEEITELSAPGSQIVRRGGASP